MVSFKKIFLSSCLVLFTTSQANAVSYFGAYVEGHDMLLNSGPLPYASLEDGGVGFSSASISSSTFGATASIGGTQYTPTLRAWSESTGAFFDDDITIADAKTYQVYTSSTTQTITLDLSLHGIETTEAGAALAYSSVLANISVTGNNKFNGTPFYISEAYYCSPGQQFAIINYSSDYLCGSNLGSTQLSILSGEQTITSQLSFDVAAGESFAIYAHLSADSRNGTANADNTFTVNFADASNIQALGVSAVPVPAAIWLFASGLVGLIGIARSKKA